MSNDEIRNQKALAYLEFKEAEDLVANLEKERAALARDIHSMASMLDKMPGGMLPTFKENYQRLTPDAVFELLSKLERAKQQLADATAKKSQFGL